VLHFSIFCVLIGEGWDTLAKKVVYTPREGKLKDYAKFRTQKRNTYGRGPRHFEKNVVFTYGSQKKLAKSFDTFGNFA